MLNEPEAEGRSRQEQILLMAAEGLTDKEIAAKLGLSPETIGTYWRRILAKYSAASRTEVVAKAIRLQSQASMGQLSDVNEALREVTDHLLWELTEHQRAPAEEDLSIRAVLDAIPDLIVQVDTEGFVLYTNASRHGVHLPESEPLEWAVERDDVDILRESLGKAFEGEATALTLRIAGTEYDTKMGLSDPEGAPSVVLSLRRT